MTWIRTGAVCSTHSGQTHPDIPDDHNVAGSDSRRDPLGCGCFGGFREVQPSADLNNGNVQQEPELLYLVCDMSYSHGTVMCRAFGVPGFNEFARP